MMVEEEFLRSLLKMIRGLSENSLNEFLPKRKRYPTRLKCQSIQICGRALNSLQALKQTLSDGKEKPLSYTDTINFLLDFYTKNT